MLSYKAGELLAPKQSLLLGVKESSQSTNADDTWEQHSATHNAMTRGDTLKRPSAGSGHVGSTGEDGCWNSADGRASSSNGSSDGGFQALIYMMRSLGSPIQVNDDAAKALIISYLMLAPAPRTASLPEMDVSCTLYRFLTVQS